MQFLNIERQFEQQKSLDDYLQNIQARYRTSNEFAILKNDKEDVTVGIQSTFDSSDSTHLLKSKVSK